MKERRIFSKDGRQPIKKKERKKETNDMKTEREEEKIPIS